MILRFRVIFLCLILSNYYLVNAQQKINSATKGRLKSISLVSEFNYHRSLIIGDRYITPIIFTQTTSPNFFAGYTKVPTYSLDGALTISFETKKNIVFRTGIYVYDRKRIYQIDSSGFKKLIYPHNYLYYNNRNIEFGIPILVGYQYNKILLLTGMKIKIFGLFNKDFYYERKPIFTSKLIYSISFKSASIIPSITIDISENKYLDVGFGVELIFKKKIVNEIILQ